jgi:hypothetical protein
VLSDVYSHALYSDAIDAETGSVEWICIYVCMHNLHIVLLLFSGMGWCSWLRHCVMSRKVAGSIPDGVIGIIHWHNPSGCTVALESTQPLTEMSTRDIFWGNGGQCMGLTALPPSCADCVEIWQLQPPGALWACNRPVQGLLLLLPKLIL